jgi:hypothetical protein
VDDKSELERGEECADDFDSATGEGHFVKANGCTNELHDFNCGLMVNSVSVRFNLIFGLKAC